MNGGTYPKALNKNFVNISKIIDEERQKNNECNSNNKMRRILKDYNHTNKLATLTY